MFGGAGPAGWRKSGASKARPPSKIEISDSVRTSTPFAPTETSMPLVFQKRVAVVTYLSYGASTNTVISTDLPSGASLYAATWPTFSWR